MFNPFLVFECVCVCVSEFACSTKEVKGRQMQSKIVKIFSHVEI